MVQLANLAYGMLSYLVLACVGGIVGYYFARKRTEHEVGYGRRVEVVERTQFLVVEISEQFEAALGYIREPGPTDELPVEKIGRSVDELERCYVGQEIWLNRETFDRIDDLTAAFRARQWELEKLPRRYGDPDFESEHERVGRELERWLRSDLPEAREGLADAFRSMLGVGRWR